MACFVLRLFVRHGFGYQAGTRRSYAADFACSFVQPLPPFATHEQTWPDCLSLPWTASASVAVAAADSWLRTLSTGAVTYTAATAPDDCACAASPAGQKEVSSDCPLLFWSLTGRAKKFCCF